MRCWYFFPCFCFAHPNTLIQAMNAFSPYITIAYKTRTRTPLVLNWWLNVAPHFFLLVGKRPGTTSVQPEQQPIVHSQSAFFQWETADKKETQKNKKQRRPPIVGSATMLLHLQLSNTKLLCTTIRNGTHQGQFHKGSVVSERGATLYSQLTRQKTPEEQQGGERRGEAVECLVSWLNTFLLEKMQPTLPARFKGWAHPKRKKSFIYSPGGFGEVMSSVSGASTAQQHGSILLKSIYVYIRTNILTFPEIR